MWLEVALITIALLTLALVLAFIVYMYCVYRDSFITYYNNFIKATCANPPSTWYRGEVSLPGNPSMYNQDLAISLVDIATAVSFSNCDNIQSIPNPPGITSQYRVTGISPVSGNETMYAYAFSGPGLNIIAFTGTYSLDEWRSDITYSQTAPTLLNGYQEGMLVHSGFYGIYASVREKLWSWYSSVSAPNVPLFIAGLSLGGALTQLAGLDFYQEQPIVYSYAAPRSGNPVYAQSYDQLLSYSFRIYNTEDIAVALPPAVIDSWTYQHTLRSVPFTVALGSLYDDHTAAYRYDLPTCFPNVAVCA